MHSFSLTILLSLLLVSPETIAFTNPSFFVLPPAAAQTAGKSREFGHFVSSSELKPNYSFLSRNTRGTSLNAESWRQYVPLVVIAGVMLDVALGSPLIKAMYGKTDEDSTANTGPSAINRNERINSDEIAKKAIEKAKATLEIQEYRLANQDPKEKLLRQIEKQQAKLDEKLKS